MICIVFIFVLISVVSLKATHTHTHWYIVRSIIISINWILFFLFLLMRARAATNQTKWSICYQLSVSFVSRNHNHSEMDTLSYDTHTFWVARHVLHVNRNQQTNKQTNAWIVYNRRLKTGKFAVIVCHVPFFNLANLNKKSEHVEKW